MNLRETLKDKKKIVIKIGSSSLTHKETGGLDYVKLEVLVREISNLRNQGKDVILVSSGAIAVGKRAIRLTDTTGHRPLAVKQACAAIGQAKLMMVYQKLFAEYNQTMAQILLTKNTILDNLNRYNAHNTLSELLKLGVIPVVNENDTIATYEIQVDDNDVLVGDNDTLSAIIAALVDADLLILLSDIDGLYTDDPRKNPAAIFIEEVEELTAEYIRMGKASTGSNIGTGGMNTKITAAQIAINSGADMVIANSRDMSVIHRIMDGKNFGTIFKAKKNEDFDLQDFVERLHQ
ncbi:MAG: glutamate 5-kinase [Roseburia sp.]|nr:glutamate 5-kinase [Roseburia sp.]MCM1279216.1 glutamate 5-kinase [Robinsoniella sp.]